MPKLNLYRIYLVLLVSSILSACSHVPITPNNYTAADTANQHDLLLMRQQGAGSQSHSKKTSTAIRLQGLKEVAMTLGAQGALANRSYTINQMLEAHHGELDQVYNFQSLLLSHNVLPPVLAAGDRTLNKNDDNTIRLSDRSYRIVHQARFVTAPPNWREYLLLTYEKPEKPDFSLLPRENSSEEIQAWKAGIQEGWEQGSSQANQIFAANLAQLQRDYNGMVLYRRLINYHMITSPVVAETNLGITGGGDELTINDRFKRITQASGLIPDADQWRPAVAQPFTEIAPPAQQPMKPAKVIPDMQPVMDPSTYVK